MKARKGKYFFRGVKVPDKKYLSMDIPIVEMETPDFVAIDLGQHIGKPSECAVTVGQNVRQGELIAKSSAYVGADIFSSVSGTVRSVEMRPNAHGALHQFVIIENDGHYEKVFLPDMPEKTPQAIVRRISEAGVVGMGGAGFPTAVKLSPKTKTDILIINGAECEPYLTCDYRLMIEKTDEVARGIRYLATACEASHIIVAIEENKPKAIALFEKYDDFDVVILRKKYPMGSEKHLIYCATGRKVPPGKLPADVGCVVQNVATAYATYEAVDKNKPLYERVMTVSGEGILYPHNLLVKNGTNYKSVLNFCGGIKEDASVVIAGGPMMGAALLSTDLYTRKTDSGLTVLQRGDDLVQEPSPCIRCGACASVCPMKLLPMTIDFYTLAGDYEKADKLGGVNSCISCGSCAYVCPAKRPLVQSITLCKTKLKGGVTRE